MNRTLGDATAMSEQPAGPEADPWTVIMGFPLEGSRRPFDRSLWPEDIPDGVPLHRALNRAWFEWAMGEGGADRHITASEAERFWQGLVDGNIRTAILASGRLQLIEPSRWEAERREFYSTGRASVDGVTGDIYVLRDPTVGELPDWWPEPEQSLVSWATDPVVEREAERRLKAVGARLNEAAKARAMKAMASEARKPWTASSIEATRARSR